MDGVFDGSDASKHPEILRRLLEEKNRAGIPLPKVGVTAASYLKRNQFLNATTPAKQQPVANPLTPAQQQQGFKDGDHDLTLPNRPLYPEDQGKDDIKQATACANSMKLIKLMEIQSNQPSEVNRFVSQKIYDNRADVTTLDLHAIDTAFTQVMSAFVHQNPTVLATNTSKSIDIKLNAAHVENEKLRGRLHQSKFDRKRSQPGNGNDK